MATHLELQLLEYILKLETGVKKSFKFTFICQDREKLFKGVRILRELSILSLGIKLLRRQLITNQNIFSRYE